MANVRVLSDGKFPAFTGVYVGDGYGKAWNEHKKAKEKAA